jgi:hypothetical protein
VGRCDAKYYGAHEPGCDCICQGKNHGAGLRQATRNTKVESRSINGQMLYPLEPIPLGR